MIEILNDPWKLRQTDEYILRKYGDISVKHSIFNSNEAKIKPVVYYFVWGIQ